MINRNGTIQRCGRTSIKALWNLIGVWEVDTETVDKTEEQMDRLGVCITHFHYDQNKLNSKGLEKQNTIQQASLDTFVALYA